MSAIDHEPFPRGALIRSRVPGGLCRWLITTASADLSQVLNPRPPAPISATPAARTVDLRFFDRPDGSVSVRNADDSSSVAQLAPGTNGFIRGVMRGLAHDRLRRGIGAQPPFVLQQWSGGRLTLTDQATGRVIDLDAFGITNKADFVALLPRGGPA